jgi:hypothetical protein
VTKEIDTSDVQDGAVIELPTVSTDWPLCPCCRDKLIITQTSATTYTQASCGCGIWTSTYVSLGRVDVPREDYELGVTLRIGVRVRHPWNMSAIGTSFVDGAKKVCHAIACRDFVQAP